MIKWCIHLGVFCIVGLSALLIVPTSFQNNYKAAAGRTLMEIDRELMDKGVDWEKLSDIQRGEYISFANQKGREFAILMSIGIHVPVMLIFLVVYFLSWPSISRTLRNSFRLTFFIVIFTGMIIFSIAISDLLPVHQQNYALGLSFLVYIILSLLSGAFLYSIRFIRLIYFKMHGLWANSKIQASQSRIRLSCTYELDPLNDKKKVVFFTFCIVISCCFFLFAKENKIYRNVQSGSIENSVYTNHFLGFSIKFPDNWYIQDIEAIKQATDMASHLLAGEGKDVEVNPETILFIASQYPTDEIVHFNPNILGMAERVDIFPEIQQGIDYLLISKEFIQTSNSMVMLSNEMYTEKIDGYSFDVMSTEWGIMPWGFIKQKYYVTLHGRYALSFIISYIDEEDKDTLKKIIETIKKIDSQ